MSGSRTLINAPRNRGNPRAAGTVGNLGGGTQAAATRRAHGSGGGGACKTEPSFDLTPYPGGFSFTKASKGQCLAQEYAIGEGTQEAGYFLPKASFAIKAAAALPITDKPPLVLAMGAAAESNTVLIQKMFYGQLRFESHPDITGREPPKDEEDWLPDDGRFDMYYTTERRGGVDSRGARELKEVKVTWVQSPDGAHYELLGIRHSAFNAKIIIAPDGELKEAGAATAFCLDADGDSVDVAEGLPEYAARLRLGFRPGDACYTPSDKPRELCVVVEFGEIRSGDFMAWVRPPLPTAPQRLAHASRHATLRNQSTAALASALSTSMAPPNPTPPCTLATPPQRRHRGVRGAS